MFRRPSNGHLIIVHGSGISTRHFTRWPPLHCGTRFFAARFEFVVLSNTCLLCCSLKAGGRAPPTSISVQVVVRFPKTTWPGGRVVGIVWLVVWLATAWYFFAGDDARRRRAGGTWPPASSPPTFRPGLDSIWYTRLVDFFLDRGLWLSVWTFLSRKHYYNLIFAYIFFFLPFEHIFETFCF